MLRARLRVPISCARHPCGPKRCLRRCNSKRSDPERITSLSRPSPSPALGAATSSCSSKSPVQVLHAGPVPLLAVERHVPRVCWGRVAVDAADVLQTDAFRCGAVNQRKDMCHRHGMLRVPVRRATRAPRTACCACHKQRCRPAMVGKMCSAHCGHDCVNPFQTQVPFNFPSSIWTLHPVAGVSGLISR